MAVKITSLELENVKRIKAVQINPTAKGLTLIGGKNRQGKSSVLDSIAFALGGAAYKPTNVKRDGSAVDPYMRIELSNGIIVERKGKSSSLKVTDPSGRKSGQELINSFLTTFALDVPKFMAASDKDKAKTLLQIIGVGDKLVEYDRQEDRLTAERLLIGRTAKEMRGHAEQMPAWDGVPEEPISVTELIQEQQAILARNGQREQWKREYDSILSERERVDEEVDRLTQRIAELNQRKKDLDQKAKLAAKSPKELQMESTAELEDNIEHAELINSRVRDNLAKAKAVADAEQYELKYTELTDQIQGVRDARMALLDDAEMPLPGLSIDHGSLVYRGQPWDNMSGSEQMQVATAIVRKINPQCGFVLLDKLEQMDLDTLREFAEWLEQEDLQAIATRVSTGDECTVWIDDGYSVDKDGNRTAEEDGKPAEKMTKAQPDLKTTKWKADTF